MRGEVERWDGGYVRVEASGRKVYVIRRRVGGVQYEVSTRCHNATAAHQQLKRFEADPDGYSPRGQVSANPLYLDASLARDFLEWSRDVRRNSPEWITKQKGFLAWWAENLRSVDLRRAKVAEHLHPALIGATSRNHRIATLKAFYVWLRKERNLLSISEDPTFQALPIPQAKPEQWKRVKAIAKEDYLKVRKALREPWRDAVDVQAGTGWHTSELQRFARDGEIETHGGKDKGAAGVLTCPQTKSGEMLRTAVSAAVLNAAKALRAYGSFGISRYGMAVKAACIESGVAPFTPGQFRHSVATWAVNAGADPAGVAAFLNHRSARTTMKFYATHSTPKKVPTLL